MKQTALIGMIAFLMSNLCLDANAEIIPAPQALSQPTTITLVQGKRYEIRGGSRAGPNLFHVFKKFSLRQNQEAVFLPSNNVRHIFARVNDGNPSIIFGKIRSSGSANLFFLNPSGIHFGPRASLDVGGSFIGTTAASIQFADGVSFAQTAASETPLLTSSIPVGLGFGAREATIKHESRENLETGPFALLSNADFKVPEQQTLALIGGQIELDGGALFVENGHIELAGIGPNQSVQLNPTRSDLGFDYREVSDFRSINLQDQAFINASGSRGSSIHLFGSDLNIVGGSRMIASTSEVTGRPLKLRLQNRLNIIDPLSSLITQTIGDAQASTLDIRATDFHIEDGALVLVRTLDTGPTGNLNVSLSGNFVMENRLLDPLKDSPRSLLSVATGTSIGVNGRTVRGVGDLGNAEIHANSIILNNSEWRFSALDSGNVGTINIEATQRMQLKGSLTPSRANILVQTQLSSLNSPQEGGNLNRLNLTTPRLTLQEGARIRMNNLASSDPGLINIVAQDILLDKSSIETFLQQSGKIGSDIKIVSDQVVLQGSNAKIATQRQASNTGNPGNIFIDSRRLIMQGDALIEGNPDLETRAIVAALAPGGNEDFSNTGGNLTLNISGLLLLKNALISTEVFQNNNEGAIKINQQGNPGYILAIANTNSDIRSRASDGSGGAINLDAKGIFGFQEVITLADRERAKGGLTNDIDASSNNVNNFGTITGFNDGIIVLEEDQSPPSLDKATVNQQCDRSSALASSRFIDSGKGGLAKSPMAYAQINQAWEDLRLSDESSKSALPFATTSKVTMDSHPTIVEAQGLVRSDAGQLMLVTDAIPTKNSWMASKPCMTNES